MALDWPLYRPNFFVAPRDKDSEWSKKDFWEVLCDPWKNLGTLPDLLLPPGLLGMFIIASKILSKWMWSENELVGGIYMYVYILVLKTTYGMHTWSLSHWDYPESNCLVQRVGIKPWSPAWEQGAITTTPQLHKRIPRSPDHHFSQSLYNIYNRNG